MATKRHDIEVIFKTTKEYLDLLLLPKRKDATILGKILHDIINTTSLLLFRKGIKQSEFSNSEIFGKCRLLMCCRRKEGTVTVETPNKHVKEYYKLLDITIPAHVE